MTTVFEPLSIISERPLIIPGEDVDTDQIIPAQFLTTTSRKGLGNKVFFAWRHDEDGNPIPDHFLNQPVKNTPRKIILAGKNFGCGSSREHAAWALYDYGVRVIIGHKISDIFRNNALKNGIAAIEVSQQDSAVLMDRGGEALSVDLSRCEIETRDGRSMTFNLDSMSLSCLQSGQDQFGKLIEHISARDSFENNHRIYYRATL